MSRVVRRAEGLLEGYARTMGLLVDMLVVCPRTYQTMLGEQFAHVIRAAIGPDELTAAARERYLTGQTDLDTFLLEVDRIAHEFGQI